MKNIASIILLGFLAACSNQKVANDPARIDTIPAPKITEPECPPDLMCTMEYRTISVFVKNKAGMPVVLDSFSTRLVSNQNSLVRSPTDDFAIRKAEGMYPIASDNMVRVLPKAGEPAVFRGYKNGREIVKADYVIGHDCCHITLISGPKELVINE